MEKTYTRPAMQPYLPVDQSPTKSQRPFEGVTSIDIVVQTNQPAKREIDKAGALCHFYICHLPFLDC